MIGIWCKLSQGALASLCTTLYQFPPFRNWHCRARRLHYSLLCRTEPSISANICQILTHVKSNQSGDRPPHFPVLWLTGACYGNQSCRYCMKAQKKTWESWAGKSHWKRWHRGFDDIWVVYQGGGGGVWGRKEGIGFYIAFNSLGHIATR